MPRLAQPIEGGTMAQLRELEKTRPFILETLEALFECIRLAGSDYADDEDQHHAVLAKQEIRERIQDGR